MPHELTCNVNGELIRTGQAACMRRKFRNGQLQNLRHLVHLDRAATHFGCVQRGLIVVAQKMFVLALAGRGKRCSEQSLRQDDSSSQAVRVRRMATLSNTVEPVTGGNYPSIGDRPLEILAEVLEHGWVVR